MTRTVPLAEAKTLPVWRRPVTLLFLMAAAMPVAFATWSALLNNFVIEVAGFDGKDIGWLHTVREIPGFLAIGVIAIIIFMREQVLGLVSLLLLGVATAVTAWFPSLGGILTITMLSSIGFHYYETVNQSLQLQWLDKLRAPKMLGWLLAAGSAATLVAYGLIVATWETLGLTYNIVYLLAGGFTAAVAIFCMFAYPQFEAPNPQVKKMILRRRYWLYYLLQFMAGARRQIFVVFAGFMMVEKFGFQVHEVTALFLINLVANMIFAPLMGRAVFQFFSDVDDFVSSHENDDAMALYVEGMKGALSHLKDATMWLMKNGMSNFDNAGAASHDYLELFGLTAMGLVWGRMAAVAKEKSGGGDAFYKHKLATAEYFFRRVLPDAASYVAKVKTGAEPVMALPADAF